MCCVEVDVGQYVTSAEKRTSLISSATKMTCVGLCVSVCVPVRVRACITLLMTCLVQSDPSGCVCLFLCVLRGVGGSLKMSLP